MNSLRRVGIGVALGLSLTCAAPFGFAPASAQTTPTGKPASASPTPAPTTIALPANALLPISLNFDIWNGLMVVNTLVGGKSPRRFVVDPGLNQCTLAPGAAQVLTVASTPDQTRVTFYDLHNTATTAPQGHISSLQFNGLKLENVPVGLVDVFTLLSPVLARRPDAPAGWLGAPLLGAFLVTIDYDKHSLQLNRPDAKLPKVKDAITVPMELRDGCVWVKMKLPGARPFFALLSTSAPVTVIPTASAQQAHLKAVETVPFRQTDGKTGKVARVVLPEVEIGKASVESMNAVFVPQDAPPELDRNLAVLGPDFLHHYKVTINYAKRLLIFTPPPPPPGTVPKDEEAPKEPSRPPKGSKAQSGN